MMANTEGNAMLTCEFAGWPCDMLGCFDDQTCTRMFETYANSIIINDISQREDKQELLFSLLNGWCVNPWMTSPCIACCLLPASSCLLCDDCSELRCCVMIVHRWQRDRQRNMRLFG
jgi:hypothetical protein